MGFYGELKWLTYITDRHLVHEVTSPVCARVLTTLRTFCAD